MSRLIFFLIAFSLSLSGALHATPYRCIDVLENYRVSDEAVVVRRLKEIVRPDLPQYSEWLAILRGEGKLLYKGNHHYEGDTAFLASNEFDWAKTQMDREPTDLFIGFGTNSAWDLAVRKKAKDIVIADWSPAPILAQALFLSPMMRIANTAQEFIALVGGVPAKYVHGKSVAEAFEFVRNAQRKRTSVDHSTMIEELTDSLLRDTRISSAELRFIALYLRLLSRGFPHSSQQFGPFTDLRSGEWANFNQFWGDRYHPQAVGDVDSVFSSPANFSYLKQMFDTNHVHFALAEISDPNFYQALHDAPELKGHRKVSFSASNIFDMNYHSSVGINAFQGVLTTILKAFPESTTQGTKLTVFQTIGGAGTHNYYRYEINSPADIRTQVKESDFNEPTDARRQGRGINILGIEDLIYFLKMSGGLR